VQGAGRCDLAFTSERLSILLKIDQKTTEIRILLGPDEKKNAFQLGVATVHTNYRFLVGSSTLLKFRARIVAHPTPLPTRQEAPLLRCLIRTILCACGKQHNHGKRRRTSEN